MKKIIKVKAVRPEERDIFISTDFIKLDSFLKLADIASTGGEAKLIIQNGEISVNGEVCLQRGRKLRDSDTVRYEKTLYTVRQNERREDNG